MGRAVFHSRFGYIYPGFGNLNSIVYYHLFLEEVPAYVCAKCKEKLFEETEVEAIQRLIKHLESDVHQLQRV